MLIIALLVVLASFTLRMRSDERVGLAWVPGILLPPLCLSREWLGMSCPGCGLTRSFVCLAQGDWSAAWDKHRLGWLLAILVLLQIPYRIHGLRNPGKALPTWARKWISQVLIGLLVGNWVLGLFV
jgi:hypothetical protein